MDKKIIEYSIPIQDKEHIELHYKLYRQYAGEDVELPKYYTTEEHINILLDKFLDAIQEIVEKNFCYIGDDIKVKIELEYKPESK